MHCLRDFFGPTVWNSDVMAGAPAAILGPLAMAQVPGASTSEGFTGRDPLLHLWTATGVRNTSPSA